jgi:hypothetical protein
VKSKITLGIDTLNNWVEQFDDFSLQPLILTSRRGITPLGFRMTVEASGTDISLDR